MSNIYDVAPGKRLAAVTTSDTADFTAVPRALFIGTGGDLKVIAVDDTSNAGVTLKNVASGSILTIKFRRVLSSGTTATDIVAIY